ncbi:MAG TPA: hypothetical protein VNO50_16380 [Pyrinomonadaceae bacterium]|nr:hypothetical protein [Pyrinomonadaceae bacterium]
MLKFLLVVLLLATQGVYVAGKGSRTLSGIIYFTNNSPDNIETYPVELYSRNQKRRLVASKANADSTFKFSGLKPGKYLLKFAWPPNRCTLWYRVSVPEDSNKRIRVIMDAACSKHNGKIQDLIEN